MSVCKKASDPVRLDVRNLGIGAKGLGLAAGEIRGEPLQGMPEHSLWAEAKSVFQGAESGCPADLRLEPNKVSPGRVIRGGVRRGGEQTVTSGGEGEAVSQAGKKTGELQAHLAR